MSTAMPTRTKQLTAGYFQASGIWWTLPWLWRQLLLAAAVTLQMRTTEEISTPDVEAGWGTAVWHGNLQCGSAGFSRAKVYKWLFTNLILLLNGLLAIILLLFLGALRNSTLTLMQFLDLLVWATFLCTSSSQLYDYLASLLFSMLFSSLSILSNLLSDLFPSFPLGEPPHPSCEFRSANKRSAGVCWIISTRPCPTLMTHELFHGNFLGFHDFKGQCFGDKKSKDFMKPAFQVQIPYYFLVNGKILVWFENWWMIWMINHCLWPPCR